MFKPEAFMMQLSFFLIRAREICRLNLFDYVFPSIGKSDFIFTIKVALAGACLAGLYGVCHDQITYLISDEYFYKLKFKQFSYLNSGYGDRLFVAVIGFFTGWLFGFTMGWLLARRYVSSQPKERAVKQIRRGFIIIFIFALTFFSIAGIYGYLFGRNHDYTSWMNTLTYYGISDFAAFVRVAYMHNASYLGGLIGLAVTFYFIKPSK